jgi:hypothetical protein
VSATDTQIFIYVVTFAFFTLNRSFDWADFYAFAATVASSVDIYYGTTLCQIVETIRGAFFHCENKIFACLVIEFGQVIFHFYGGGIYYRFCTNCAAGAADRTD